MTDTTTVRDAPAQQEVKADSRRDLDRPAEREPDDFDVPAVRWGMVRPVWVGPPGDRSHRPIFREHQTLWMAPLPRPRARTDLVVVTRRHRPALLGSVGAPSRWSLFFSPGTLYEVDKSLHHTSFDIELPSSADTFAFRAEVSVEWRVDQSAVVVADNLRDVRAALAPIVRHNLCEITRGFDVGEVISAERAVSAAVHTLSPGADYGLMVTLTIRLSADTGAAEFAASQRELEQRIRIEELKNTHHSLQVSHEHAMIDKRMALYKEIIDADDVDQLALQLAQNPSGVDSIITMVREERHRDRRQVTEFVTHLLGSGAIDRWDVEDQVKMALEWLKVSTDRTVQTGHAHIPRQRRPSTVGEPVDLNK